MLNINQNFDLKAPVFNFDRDYFNSVEELNAYDTSNVPDHFVTNVAGMLYLFTDGKWLPMINTEYGSDTNHYVNLGCNNAYINVNDNSYPIFLTLYGEDDSEATMTTNSLNINSGNKYVSITADYDESTAGITVSGDSSSGIIITNNLIICGDDSFKVDIYGDEGRIEINDAQGRRTNYSASGFSGQTKDNTTSYSLSLPSKNTDIASFSLKSDLGDFTFDASNGLNIDYNTGYSIFTDMGDGSINLTSTSEGSNYSNTICPGEISIHDRDDDQLFVISCLDSTEGAVISGIKSLTAFANPSATKVWATDGSTVDLTNYFNGTTTVDKLKSKAVEVIDTTNSVIVSPTGIIATNGSTNGSIKMLTNNELTEIEGYMCSPVDMSFTNNDGFSAHINSRAGFIHTTEDRMVSRLSGSGLTVDFPFRDNRKWNSHLDYCGLWFSFNDEDALRIWSGSGDEISIELGSDEETRFKISRPLDNTEGATITGVKSIKAFSDPSNTKVFATDGSIADLSTKANTSDVLLKKSASGGYYIEANSNQLGEKAFAANSGCTASGSSSFAEGVSTKAIGIGSHAEGNGTKALGNYAHAEGENTKALGNYSHAEGRGTSASDDCSHAEGNGTDAQHCSHAEGNYTHAVGMYTHAEGEYTSASGGYSHAEGFATLSNGTASHSEGDNTKASGFCAHSLGTYNVVNKNAIHSVGIGNHITRKNAEYIYAKNNESGTGLTNDPKNGYKYLIGVGGYDGISTDNTTYKSVQEVIADLTARIEQLETLVANCVSISNVDEQTN